MELFEVVRRRISVRKFSSKTVDEALVESVLEAANRAPSAGNLQAYQIVIVKDPELKAKLTAATGNQTSVTEAPIVLVFCAHPERSATRYGSKGEELFCVQDATIACAYAQLAATALGLASVWVGAVFEPETVMEALQLEQGLWPIALLPIGYPAETPAAKSRRPLRELVRELT